MKTLFILLTLSSFLILHGTRVHADSARYIIMHNNTEAPHFRQDFNASHIYHIIPAYAATLTSDQVHSLKSTRGVQVYPDVMGNGSLVETMAPWGLDRIDQRHLPLDKTYHFPTLNPVNRVDVYVLDSGILVTHEEFEGRAVWGTNFADTIDTDCNGHGTHVAGIIGGKTYGVAKDAHLIAVKILGCDNRGWISDWIAAIEYVIGQHSGKTKSVINLSAQADGGVNIPLNAAVEAAVKAGIHFAVAAGNQDDNTCGRSPASAPGALTVAASDIDDQRAVFSAHGSCVDLFAPGVDIPSSWIGANNAIALLSGTSMASPHVAGAAARIIHGSSAYDNNPEALAAFLKSTATIGAIPAAELFGSPNLLLFLESVAECSGVQIPTFDGKTKYCVLSADTEANLRNRCKNELGGGLANIYGSSEFLYLGEKITKPSYINSWNTDDYGPTCIALYPHGAIAQPPEGCGTPGHVLPGICEYPV